MTVDQGSESRESYLIVLKSMYLEVSMGHEMSKKIELKKLNKKKKKNNHKTYDMVNNYHLCPLEERLL